MRVPGLPNPALTHGPGSPPQDKLQLGGEAQRLGAGVLERTYPGHGGKSRDASFWARGRGQVSVTLAEN